MTHLEPALKQEINTLINESMAVFSLENPTPGLSILLRAWELLPDDKQDSDEGYMLSKYIIHVYFRTGDFVNAALWQDTFTRCDQATRNTGESEFMAGKIAFAQGNMEAAKSFFSIANRKSEGRCFTKDDKQYKALLDKKEIRPTEFKALLDLSFKEFDAKNYSYALSLLYDCLNLQLMSPVVYLQKGKCHFELNELDHAADALTRAFMLEGLDVFKHEDPKYIAFLKTRIDIS